MFLQCELNVSYSLTNENIKISPQQTQRDWDVPSVPFSLGDYASLQCGCAWAIMVEVVPSPHRKMSI